MYRHRIKRRNESIASRSSYSISNKIVSLNDDMVFKIEVTINKDSNHEVFWDLSVLYILSKVAKDRL